jgi:septal ring factor EnvC (AmiA/AmiB activator)
MTIFFAITTAVLTMIVLYLLAERRERMRKIAHLERQFDTESRSRRMLLTQVNELNRDARSMHEQSIALHAQVEGLRERVAHLKQHNDQLTFDALVNSRGLYKFFIN